MESSREEKAFECLSNHLALNLQEGDNQKEDIPLPSNSDLKRTLLEQELVLENTNSITPDLQELSCHSLGKVVEEFNKSHGNKTTKFKKKNYPKSRENRH